MKIPILTIIFSFYTLFAQGITNTIGGKSHNDKFIIENSDSESILVVNGLRNVGIGTTKPFAPLTVVYTDPPYDGLTTAGIDYMNSSNVAGDFHSNVYDSPYGIGVSGLATPNGNFGVGVSGNAGWIGVRGNASSLILNADGNFNTAPDRIGVYGQASYGNLTNRGVEGVGYYGTYSYGGRFESHEGLSHSFGIWAIAMDAPHTAGVYGVSRNTSAQTWGMGTYGEATGPNNANYGVYGYADGALGNANWAGYFQGKVNVTGTLYTPGGSYKIDHPDDPENKFLSHSFVESPDMMNIYNGNVILNYAGEADVDLPDYFNSLNSDFRYQLTAIGSPGPDLYIAQKVSGNTFNIAGGIPGMEVSWQITGIRQDAYAKTNRIIVEENKTGDEIGKYLHPEVFGLSLSQGINNVSILNENEVFRTSKKPLRPKSQ